MKPRKNHITIFEHQSIRQGDTFKGCDFDDSILKSLQAHFGTKGVPYYSLIHKGVKFNEYVGVIQVGKTTIEVLPKADNRDSDHQELKWRKILIGMLRAVNSIELESTSNSNLRIKPNSILDLYFELLVIEIEHLLHNGLLKQYRKKESNLNALIGRINFSKNIQKNLIHKERFYVNHTVYDQNHKLHQILYKAILILKQINTNIELQSRIGTLLLNFPKMPDIKISESLFEKINFNRKNTPYKKAIDIAKMILLQYHPDLLHGRNHILAIMFNMNLLWERFVYHSLKSNPEQGTVVKKQNQKSFWIAEDKSEVKVKPDIIFSKNSNQFVLDTKWKILKGGNPSVEDLRQMYVYHEYYNAKKVALVYPADYELSGKVWAGKYIDHTSQKVSNKECSNLFISSEENIAEWQKNIYLNISKWSVSNE
ncbi:McrC family protein [Leptospira levettii]|uniref:McrC family protein n=1 Tax=Leptospira levettii TaxID=2023178 RepID=UPI00223D164D|nr:hypothetical protein [Leptospira levettii]MCW7498457.1 McrC family protein [Leptospira levettii]